MTATVFNERPDVQRRTRELGLTHEGLVSTIKAAVAAVGSCTADSPPGAPGWMSWHGAVVRLRQEFRRHGWEKDDTANFATIVHPAHTVRIAVAGTDDATGNPRIYPTNRSRKGGLGQQAVSINQLRLPLGDGAMMPFRKAELGRSTWYLCLWISGEHVRAELSLPVLCPNGYFADWDERILLVSSDDDWRRLLTPDVSPPADDGPDFRVTITRK